MKYLLPVFAAALITACGQKKEESPPPPETTASATPSTPPLPPADAGTTATVQLAATQGHKASGSLTLAPMGNGVHLTGMLTGLTPSAEFGFHIHEKGDCSAPDASSAGGHFNPSGVEHGNPQGDKHHAGDMLNLKSDAEGNAQVSVHVDGVSLGDASANDVLGRAVVLHEKADDYQSQPAGNSGARIACGVIAAAGI